MSRGKNIQYTMIKNIFSGSLTATVWIFEMLINMGILTAEAFLNPSIYKEPAYFSFVSGDLKSNKKKHKKKPSDVSIRQSLWRLKKAGFLEKKGRNFFLTKKGKQLADYILARQKVFKKKWDEKFRVVIFDIPEKKRRDRNWLRHELYIIGYKKLQESVFVGKAHLPEDLIKNIKQRKIGNFVNYILADKVYKNINGI